MFALRSVRSPLSVNTRLCTFKIPTTLFVANVPWQTRKEDLHAHFSQCGEVGNIHLPIQKETGRPRGFAFVDFANLEDAEKAIKSLHEKPFQGRNLAVHMSKSNSSGTSHSPLPFDI
eukprot:TRINITY_DN702_c1_g2_i3.p1 TRINITY_DN702_c1_g2~~TRINITY_DN702_c1_g2_i3.p1  ORF type:complete len:117 (+),score=15.89 TRINITY_DN702_c1_g2_i3:109-459(+)